MWRYFYLSLLFILLAAHRLEADEATVTTEDEPQRQEDPSIQPMSATESEQPNGSPHVEAIVALTSPPLGRYTTKRDISFPSGKRSSMAAVLVNTHEGTTLPRFTLDLIEGALHYPGYYEHIIQNFTKNRLQNTLEPGQEGSIYYSFLPAVELTGRSFDLSVTVYYHDENEAYYRHSLFNQTVFLHEVEEGVDTQMIFLVTLVVASAVVVLIGAWHWLFSKASRRRPNTNSSGSSQQHTTKADSVDGGNVIENEYLSVLSNKKYDRSGRELTRRHGKR